MVWILHKEQERWVENLRYMNLAVVQLKIKNKYEIPACELTIPDQSTWSVTVEIN